MCDSLVSEEELRNVIKNLKLNKSSGLDGLYSQILQTILGQT